MNEQKIREAAWALADWTADIRHALHRVPERGFEEFKTREIIRRTLTDIGIPFSGERTWTIGVIRGAHPGLTIALRADIDALPIQEETGLPFASEHPGMMHACGHDAHAAMLLGAARLLWEMRDSLSGTVRLLFQPAEETVGGAEPMIAAGAMEGVDRVYGIHVASQAPVGQIATRGGATHANTDEFHLHVLGRGGHGAHPRTGVDAIVIAAHIITALQTLITRETEATESAVITVGSIHGGQACNVLCDEVVLYGTLRTLDDRNREQFSRRIEALSRGIAQAMGGDVRVRFDRGYCACINDDAEARRVLDTAARLFGPENTRVLKGPSMGGEDFGFYLREAPGAFFNVGTGSEAPLHNGKFILDDACLPYGVAMHAALACQAGIE
ncbi:MAG: M20 family metallopeptidase [Christensenellales bacterium]|jgi:amidohydrolase|uniref:Amidohydrolase n=1 Tax=Candidatus Avichristensenella intestinipullorum TaxID=2840693 RepID=A0A9D0YYG2_9FIRM|nr:M20 family metallopeptidase [Christensenellales bacterium]HIQ63706.1 amidohydrolase [Candidatus Avichristensenella intestinipullorum]